MKKETKWSIDPAHSEIAFKVRHLMISNVKGCFKTFDASIYTTGKDFSTAEIDLWIDVSSISTNDEKRDGHLAGADFFDAENHKQITFVSNTVEKTDAESNQELWGDLTMRGISKNIKLNVEFGGIATDPWGNEKAGFTVTGKINRTDWGLVWNATMEAGGILVGEEITISCDIQLVNSSRNVPEAELEASAENTLV